MRNENYVNVPTEEGYTPMMLPDELEPLLALKEAYRSDIYVVLSFYPSRKEYVVHTYNASSGMLGNGHHFTTGELMGAMNDTIRRAHRGAERIREWHRPGSSIRRR